MKDVQVSGPVYKTKLNGESSLGETIKKAVGRVYSCRKNITRLVCGKKSKEYYQAKKIPVVPSVTDSVLIRRKKRPQSQSMSSTKQRKKLTVQSHNLLSTLNTEIE